MDRRVPRSMKSDKRSHALVRELEQVIHRSKRVVFSFQLDVPQGYVTVTCDGRPAVAAEYLLRLETRLQESFSHKSESDFVPDNLRVPFGRIRKAYPKARLRLDKITFAPRACPLKGKQLSLLLARALSEAFGGEPTPTAAAIAQARSAAAARGASTVALLASGPAGLAAWNELTKQQRRDRGPFRRVDLQGLRLDRLNLIELDFQGANLRGARLRHAWLPGCNLARSDLRDADLASTTANGARFNHANLEGARLAGNFWSARFTGANLKNADLRRAELNDTDFCGADLAGADLTGIKVMTQNGWRIHYDSHTRFSKGFEPGPAWRRRRG